jgi:NADH-quinone oxidoreductase subunit N
MSYFLYLGLLTIGPEFFFLIFALLSFVFILFNKDYWNVENITNLYIKASIYVLIFFILFIYFISGHTIVWCGFITTPFISTIKIFICILSIFILILSLDFFDKKTVEYPFLFLLAIWGMFIVVSSNNFILMFLGFEVQNFIFFVFAGLNKDSVVSKEGALRYFILGGFSSAFMLFGISIIYIYFGSIDFHTVRNILDTFGPQVSFYYLGFLFFLIGIFFKLALFPFHFWIADIYEGSPLIITMFFSTIPKVVAFFALIKIYIIVLFGFSIFFDLLNIIGVLSVLYGTMETLYQWKVIRLLAVGSISHMGLAVYSFSVFTPACISSSFIYIVVYVIVSVGFFSILVTYLKVNKDGSYKSLNNTWDFAYLLKASPLATVFFSIFLLSLGGFPPLLGFFGKFYIYYSLLQIGIVLYFIIFALLNIVSLLYYIRIVRFIFFNDENLSKNVFFRKRRKAFIVVILLIFILNFFPIFFFNFFFLHLSQYGLFIIFIWI